MIQHKDIRGEHNKKTTLSCISSLAVKEKYPLKFKTSSDSVLVIVFSKTLPVSESLVSYIVQ